MSLMDKLGARGHALPVHPSTHSNAQRAREDAMAQHHMTLTDDEYDLIKDHRAGKAKIPRRIDINRMTPAELQILACVDTVEKMGAKDRDHTKHENLMQAVTLLQDAREKVADYIDLMQPDGR